MKIYFLKVFLLLLCYAVQSDGQDVVFSNPSLSPMYLNPALTGISKEKSRLNIYYRSQHTFLSDESFKTTFGSFDQNHPIGKHDFIGLGFSILNDKAGALSFQTLQGQLATAFIKKLNHYRSRNTYLSFGLNVGFVQKRFDLNKAQWGSQFNGLGGFDPGLFSASAHLNDKNSMNLDIGTGILFFISDAKNAYHFQFGAAYRHINLFNESFVTDGVYYADRLLNVHVGGEVPIEKIHKKIRILSAINVYLQSASYQVLPSLDLRWVLKRYKDDIIFFQLGSSLRMVNNENRNISSDALIFQARLDFNNVSFGLCIDNTISELQRANQGIGSIELAVIYNVKGTSSRNIVCPDF